MLLAEEWGQNLARAELGLLSLLTLALLFCHIARALLLHACAPPAVDSSAVVGGHPEAPQPGWVDVVLGHAARVA